MRSTTLIPWREYKSLPNLRRSPDILQYILGYKNALGIFQLQKILNVVRTAYPHQRLEEVVAPNLDIGGHEVGNGRICTSKEHVFAGSLKVVVNYLEWSCAV